MKSFVKWVVFTASLIHASAEAVQPEKEDPESNKPSCEKIVLGLETDANFLATIKHVPAENRDSRFETHVPKTESQATGLAMALRLSEYYGPNTIGLVLSGSPGVGKTHLAISVARRAYEAGERVLFLTPETRLDFTLVPRKKPDLSVIKDPAERAAAELIVSNQPRHDMIPTEDALRPYSLIVIDDLNPGGDFTHYATQFRDILFWAFRQGGKKILVTTNASGKDVIDQMFYFDRNGPERQRFQDRYDSIFKEQILDGESQRPVADW